MAISELRRRRTVYQDQILTFLGSIRIFVRKIYIRGKKMPSAVFTDTTKPVFRSESARLTLLVQMSKEMWEWDRDMNGEIILAKAELFFMRLFQRWTKLRCSHIVTLVLFTRMEYSGVETPEDASPGEGRLPYKDFYRVVISDTPSTENAEILLRLGQEFTSFLRDIDLQRADTSPTVVGNPTSARRGNFLEAVSLATSAYLRDDVDSDFSRTGTSIIVVSPDVAVFDVNEDLLRLTTQSLVNRAFGMDLVCLSPVPLHVTPLFVPTSSAKAGLRKLKNGATTDVVTSRLRGTIAHDPDKDALFVVPPWIEVSFYSGDKIVNGELLGRQFQGTVPQAKMGDIPFEETTNFDTFKLQMPDEILPLAQASDETSPTDSELIEWMEEQDRIATDEGYADLDPLNMSRVARRHRATTEARRELGYDKLNTPSFSPKQTEPSRPTGQKLNVEQTNHQHAPNGASRFPLGSRGRDVSKLRSTPSLGWLLRGTGRGKAAPTTMSTMEPANPAASFSGSFQGKSDKRNGQFSDQFKASLSKVVPTKPNPDSVKEASRPISVQQSPKRGASVTAEASESCPSRASDPQSLGAFQAASASKRSNLSSVQRVSPVSKPAKRPKDRGLMPWLVIKNPSKPGDSMTWAYGHWNHAFVRHLEPSAVKWRALSAPASLPLTTEYFPSVDQLRDEFNESPYRLALSHYEDGKAIVGARAHLARELIQSRLSEGFQIAVGERSSEITGRPESKFTDLFDEGFMTDEGATVLMIRGDNIHLLCATGNEITVTRYQRKSSYPKSFKYTPELRTAYEAAYTKCLLKLDAFPDLNWNAVDNYIASQEYGVTDLATQNRYAGLAPRRVRFVLIPVEPQEQARSGGDSDEEIRTEGIRKLTIQWTRYRFHTLEEMRHRVAWDGHKDPNPLAIEYQTRDPSAIVTAGMESNLLAEGEATAAQTQLFNESEAYRTSNVDLSRLAADVQGEKGIKVRDRRWHFKTYHYCFVGLDMTSFLLSNFQDLRSREEAEAFGNALMQKGLFEHVHHRHKFRDGVFFYAILPQYRLPKGESRSSTWLGRSIPTTPLVEAQKELSDNLVESPGPKRPKVRLSEKIEYNVDPQKLSNRLEVITIHYDRLHNPENAFHVQIEWTNATARLIENAVSSWAMMLERHGLKLVQLPLGELCTINQINPFRMPFTVELALKPPAIPLRESHESPILAPQPLLDDDAFQKAILKRLDFVLDFEAAHRFPTAVDVNYSWGVPDYRYTQFVHRSGLTLAQILPGGKFLLLGNRLCHSRASTSTAHDRLKKSSFLNTNDAEKLHSATARPPYSAAASTSSPIVSTASTSSPRPRPVSCSTTTTTTQPEIGPEPPSHHPSASDASTPDAPLSAEKVKNDFEAFCHDMHALKVFYDDLIATSTIPAVASERPTPALSAASGRGAMSMTASIPSLELEEGTEGVGEWMSEAGDGARRRIS